MAKDDHAFGRGNAATQEEAKEEEEYKESEMKLMPWLPLPSSLHFFMRGKLNYNYLIWYRVKLVYENALEIYYISGTYISTIDGQSTKIAITIYTKGIDGSY